MSIYLPKLNKLYSLIYEDNKIFSYNNATQLPSKYLTIDSIKQCIISDHIFQQISWRDNKQFQYISDIEIIKKYTYRNIQLALEYVFNNKQILQKINDNEFNKNSIEFIISTDNFALINDLHLILILKVNSKSDIYNNNKYYTCFVTSYIKDSNKFNEFQKNRFKKY